MVKLYVSIQGRGTTQKFDRQQDAVAELKRVADKYGFGLVPTKLDGLGLSWDVIKVANTTVFGKVHITDEM